MSAVFWTLVAALIAAILATVLRARLARRAALVIAILLPLFAVALYVFSGGERPDPALSPEQIVEQLTARLAAEPDDPHGWDRLARSYMALGRYRDARMALQRLQTLVGDSPDLLVRLAEAESREAGGSLAGHPTELVARALALDPKHRAGLWLAGVIAAEKGDRFGAIARWKELLSLVDPSDPAYAKVEEVIRRAETEF